MSNPILSWRRVRALCVKETRQIVRDPSSWLIAVVIPLLLLFILDTALTSTPASCASGFYWNSVAKRRWISPTP
ncbi:protein of unknown function [Escherichia coli]|nr:protein of unknown function [Escherichia coli]